MFEVISFKNAFITPESGRHPFHQHGTSQVPATLEIRNPSLHLNNRSDGVLT